MLTNSPEFVLYTGPMMSSKTSRLLMCLERYKYQKKPVLAFKPMIDNRFDVGKIVTHMGVEYDAIPITKGVDILEKVQSASIKPAVIAVDEAFMIPGSAENLIWLFGIGFNIVVSSIELSYSCKPFSEITSMFPYATKVEKCTAICTVCGNDARYTYTKSINDDDIQIGGSELYEPRCFLHHPIMYSQSQ